ncbi:MAG TPA: Mrp/NBP35 family ATP-binding protein [Clostridiales bacterium]|nr:Mrp/NBP35 family ATP-binding protein [Clostridiales bacterium]
MHQENAAGCPSGSCDTCGVAGCPSAGKASNQAKHDFAAPANDQSNIRRVIGVVSGKGGVGKSMVTSLLAVAMQRRGFTTAVLDADVTGPSIPRAFGLHQKAEGDETYIYPVETKTGIRVMSINLLLENEKDPVVWRGPVIAGTVKQFWTDVFWGDVDYMFVDLPPGTGDVPLTVFQSLPLDGTIVVTSPQALVSMIVEKAVNMAKLMHIPVLGFVENMSYLSCPDCGKKLYPFGESKLDALAKEKGIPILARLPMDQKLAAAADAGTLELFEGPWLEEAANLLEKMNP